MLEELGYEADLVANGEDAIEANGSHEYAAILMDSQMPGMDGNEATRAIRTSEVNDIHVPIIALTANAMEPDRLRAFAAGVDEYLSKPIVIEDLYDSLSRLVDGHTSSPGQRQRRADSSTGGTIIDAIIVAGLQKIRGADGADLFAEIADQFFTLMPEWIRELEEASNDQDLSARRRTGNWIIAI